MARSAGEDWDDDPEEFRRVMASLPPEEFQEYLDGLPEAALQALLKDTASFSGSLPESPLAQALELEPKYVSRPHLEYLSDRLAVAVRDVQAGHSRKIMVWMPPRSGKSELISKFLPVWLLRINPSWKLGLLSYSPVLANGWSRDIRRIVENRGAELGIEIARDAGAVGDWQTTMKGEVHARSMGQGLTGLGANVLIIDDPIKDSITAHQENTRQTIWDRWTNDLQSRLEGASLTIVVQTRWHEDDLSGRLQNPAQEGSSPEDWEIISFPAIAVTDDVLGRAPGDPLFPPLIPMVVETALAWWASLKKGMSSYNWAAMYQQSPAPAQGSVFNVGWWRFWTTNPELVSVNPDTGEADGRVVLLPDMEYARLIDSWDLNYDDTAGADYVVGQRWGRHGPNRYLLDQRRGRWNFPDTLAQFEAWNADGRVHEHVVEKKANGAAMIAMMSKKYAGLKPVSPTTSKEVRARAVTPEIESGHVFLPHPMEYAWVGDLMDELREFPSGANDDQVDVLTQALSHLREEGGAAVSVPGNMGKIRRGTPGVGSTPGGPGAASGSGLPGIGTGARISRTIKR